MTNRIAPPDLTYENLKAIETTLIEAGFKVYVAESPQPPSQYKVGGTIVAWAIDFYRGGNFYYLIALED